MSASDTSKGLTFSGLQLVVGSRSIAWLVVATVVFLVALAGMALIRHVANPVFRAWGQVWEARIRGRARPR